MPDINIGSKFDAKGFKQAETATDKLGKNVKSLAKSFGLAFGTAQVLAFAKNAVKAAAEDEKAQKQLALALKNVGLERDAASSEAYIQRLQSEFGILDDKLRPAYQTLAVATGNTAEAQRLLNLSLDIAASTGKDLGSVTSALSRAYLGNNTALSKLGVGISKADLKAGKFEDIISDLEVTFKGAATQSANTFQGSIDKLGVAAANASEIIGTGLIDALKGLGDQKSVDSLATSMQNVAIYTADVIRGIGVLIEKLKGLPGVGSLDVGMIPILGTYLQMLNAAGRASTSGASGINAQGLADLARLQAAYVVKTLEAKKKLTAQELAALKAARLKLAIDKASLALGKGEDVFNMEQIQVAAALTNQAEQLAKTTTGAQALQIANDTARLNVKRSILNLEDAIAANDEKAIIKATEKLNADLKILGALTGQELKLKEIKSILDGLASKSIGITVDTADALNKIKALYESASKGIVIPVSIGSTPSTGTTGDTSGAMNIGGLYTAIGSNLKEYLVQTGLLTSGLKQGGGEYNYSITVNTGIGDPNAIAAAIQTYIIDAVNRGTLKGGATP